jgi:peptidoglycan/LPS O-acetylase OafA/YrhL
MNDRNYIPQLTFPRFIAASLVVVFHYGSSTFPFNTGFLAAIISQGSIAVSFFFFLSGLVLSLNYFRDEKLTFSGFLKKRIARIYPVYLVAFFLTLFLAMVVRGAYPKGMSAILQMLSLHAWVPGICLEINYPGWSISVEMFFYLLFPLLVFLLRKLKQTKIIILVFGIWILSVIQNLFLEKYFYEPANIAHGEFILYFPLWHLNTFLFGMLAGILILRFRRQKVRYPYLPLLMLLSGMVVFVYILGTDNPVRPHIHNGILAPLYLIITLGLAFDTSAFSRVTGSRSMVYLGDISYSIYILQFPVYLLFISIAGIPDVKGWVFYLYFPVLLIVSGISYKFIEQKFRRLIAVTWK